MALRNIVKDGDPILRKKSREVTVFDKRLHSLLQDMAETLHMADGVGLAAVQVGMLRRVVVIDVGQGIIELVNPVILEASEEKVLDHEGCLSFPQQYGMVERPKRVKVQAQNRSGDLFTMEGEDLLARAFCHEIDHLDGIVFKDHIKNNQPQRVRPHRVEPGNGAQGRGRSTGTSR